MEQFSLSESQHKTAHHKRIKSGRGWILAVAIIQTLAAGFAFLTLKHSMADLSQEEIEIMSESSADVMIYGLGAVALIFWVCWFWAKKHPFPAALVALLIYLTMHIADAILDPTVIARGIFMKLLFIIGLSQAVASAYKLKKAESE